jgi:predicted metal-binding membrane protein
VIRRDRLVIALGLAAITLLAWMYLLRTAVDMKSMAMDAQMHAAMGMTDMRIWDATDWLELFVMWAIMMVAMMLPSAAPVILIVLAAYRRRGDRGARVSAGMFVTGYMLAWTTFSALAASAQVGLHRTALLSADMTSRSTLLAGTMLLVAGIYQWLPIKTACLTHCQSPLGFLAAYWRDGAHGALTMGLRHGAFCIGCCWALMALLFVVGVMNLLWVAGIAAFVLLEKLVPQRLPIGRAAGALLILWGLFEMTRGLPS